MVWDLHPQLGGSCEKNSRLQNRRKLESSPPPQLCDIGQAPSWGSHCFHSHQVGIVIRDCNRAGTRASRQFPGRNFLGVGGGTQDLRQARQGLHPQALPRPLLFSLAAALQWAGPFPGPCLGLSMTSISSSTGAMALFCYLFPFNSI
jgi:hypothetical protein